LWKHALTVAEKNAWAHNGLGLHYYSQGKIDRAEVEFESAVATDPSNTIFHFNFGLSLFDRGACDRALVEFRKAIELDPTNCLAHTSLGNLLRDLDRREEALAEYNEAIKLYPERASPHVGRGNVLTDQGRLEEALAEYQLAVHLEPGLAIAHMNLAIALQSDGQLDEAMAQYRKASDLKFPGALSQQQECEQLRALRLRFPDSPSRRIQPADNAERLGLADLCGQPFEGSYFQAARLYAEAFTADPKLADDSRGADHRIKAAMAAARAGCGQGRDASGLEDKEKAQLRGQARIWLQAELAQRKKEARSEVPQVRTSAGQALRIWQRHAAFTGVRDAAALASLGDSERAGWQKLWQEVQATIAKANSP
jgi:tetratricopeptide (TPR) repeat protein